MNYFSATVHQKPLTDYFIQQEQISQIEISKLSPHPLQQEICGEEDIETSPVYLAIAETRDIEAITITPLSEGRYMIVKGHTRVKAAKKLGWTSIPCCVVLYASEANRDEAFLSSNTTRDETNEQRAKRANAWWKIIQAKNALKSSRSGITTREEVSRLVGWGEVTTQKAVQVARAIAVLPEQQSQEVKSHLAKSVDRAYQLIKVFDRVEVDGKPGEVRAVKGDSCLIALDEAPQETKVFSIGDIQAKEEVKTTPNENYRSVKAELRDKGRELGLKGKGQLLPDIPVDDGINPQEFIGYAVPAQIAQTLAKLTSEQLQYCLAIALPKMNTQQIKQIKDSVSCF